MDQLSGDLLKLQMNQDSFQTPIAIVGMACRLPGGSSIEAFWAFLEAGGNAIGELPPDRLDRALYFDRERGRRAKTYTALGGLIPGRPPGHEFNWPAADKLQDVDPCHRILCDVSLDAWKNAGLEPGGMLGKHVGVYVGHSGGSPVCTEMTVGTLAEETFDFIRDVPEFSSLPSNLQTAVLKDACEEFRETRPQCRAGGSSLSADRAAALISGVLKLDGPAMSIDAACASSLLALYLGVMAIQRGEIDAAVIGGASWAKADSLLLFSQAQSASDVASRPFDAAANGLVGSEGYVVLIIKSLSQAISDGDEIQAVVRGMGISTDGKGRSLWAPRKEGQRLAMERAYGGELNPGSIDYVEAHATSTQVGDATEMEALGLFFAPHLQARRIPVGSVKSNIGHTLETSGLASLLKVTLALKHGCIPPNINLHALNPSIPWEHLPFYVPTEGVQWPPHADGSPRRAGVNAFGIGGLNVHVIVDEYVPVGNLKKTPLMTSISAMSVTSIPDVDRDSLAVIGRGVVLPGARSVEELRELIETERSLLTDAPLDRWRKHIGVVSGATQPYQSPTCRGGYLVDYVYDWKAQRIPPKQIQRANPLQFMLLDATTQALAEARYDRRPYDSKRTAVVIGSAFGGEFPNQLAVGLRLPEFRRSLLLALTEHGLTSGAIVELLDRFEEVLLEKRPALLDETGSFTSSTLASRIAKTFNFMGGALAIDAADCSSLASLDVARNLLLSGACSLVVCGTGDRRLDLVGFEALASQDRLPVFPGATPDMIGRCFPGEGAAVVLLKRLSDARRDGDTIRAIIRTIGSASHPGNLSTAVESAIRRAALSPPTAMHWEFDGPLGGCLDGANSSQLAQDRFGCPTLAGQTGYLRSAHGLVALIALSVAEPSGRPPAPSELTSLTDTRQGIVTRDQNGQAYCTIIENVDAATQTGERAVAKNLLSSPPETATKAVFTLRMGASHADELTRQIEAARTDPDSWLRNPSSFSDDHEYRMAIVTTDRRSFPELLNQAAAHWRDTKSKSALEDKGIYSSWFRGSAPRIAVLFPGQGSQSSGMLRSLISASKSAQGQLEAADRCLVAFNESPFSHLAWESGDRIDTDLWTTQVAMLVADVVAYAALQEIGVRPDCFAGHSFGEYPALVASGVCTLEQAVQLTRMRTRAILEGSTECTALLAISASHSEVLDLLNDDAEQLFLTHLNAPKRTVVGGDRRALQKFADRLKSRRIVSMLLPVPGAFHTPFMRHAQNPLREALDAERLLPPRKLLLSSVTNRYMADPQDIRDNLVSQLVEPVRYEELVRRLVHDGNTILIESGPRQVLTQFNRQILEGSSTTCLCIDHPRRTPIEQFACIQAALECAGALSVGQDYSGFHSIALPSLAAFEVTTDRKTTRPSMAMAAATDLRAVSTDPVEQFDATAQRRDRNRQASSSSQVPPMAVKMFTLGGHSSQEHQAHAKPPNGEHARPPQVSQFTTSADQAVGVPQSRMGSQESLKQFLIDFIIEQTGYPPEVVDLDADLEAELGIDSIRRAQLFGEMRELNLGTGHGVRDVRTLRDILNLVNVAEHGAQDASVIKLPASDLRLDFVANSSQAVDRHFDSKLIRNAELATTNGFSELNTPESPTKHDQTRSHTREIEKFLVEFVVDQTGYPEEVVDLDADLEAELGIDSIRKAQLLGELRERIANVGTDVGLSSISQLRTLRQIVENVAGSTFNSMSVTTTVPRSIPNQLTSVSAEVRSSHDLAAPGLSTASTPAHSELIANDEFVHWLDRSCDRDANMRIDTEGQIARLAEKNLCGRSSFHDSADEPASLSLDQRKIQIIIDRLRRLADQPCDRDGSTNLAAMWELGDYFTKEERERIHTIANEVEVDPANVAAFARRYSLELLLAEADLLDRPPIADPSAHTFLATQEVQEDLTLSPVTWRHTLHVVPTPQWTEAVGSPHFHGSALILGNNDVAQALQERLFVAGINCHILEPTDDPTKTVDALEQIWLKEPVPHLFLVTPRDHDAASNFDPLHWQRRRTRGVMTPFWLCQHWLRLVQRDRLTDEASIVATTSLGGAFGFDSEVVAAESGALAGLLKAILIENWVNGVRTLPIKVIDTALTATPIAIVDSIWRELTVPSYDVEVAWKDGKRSVVRAVRKPIPLSPRKPIPERGNWVCTGGARGISAYVSRQLAARYKLTLNLLGTAPVPQIIDEWRNLSPAELKSLRNRVMQKARTKGLSPLKEWQALEKALEIDRNLEELRLMGISAHYYQCDVSDQEQLSESLNTIRRQTGPIAGVLHGAGFGKDARFQQKESTNVDKCMGAKIDGAFLLMELTRDDPLKYFVGFGSISGRFGANGHTDYSSANEMLAKQIGWFRKQRPEVAAVAFHWHAWGDVGMATKPETRLALEMVHMQFMPSAEGLNHLISELEAGAPEAEVLVTDDRYYRSFYPAETLLTEVDGRLAAVGSVLPILHDKEVFSHERGVFVELTLDPLKEPFLIEHRLDDRPLLPLVVALEMICEIATVAGVGPIGALTNVEAVHGLKFFTDEPQTIRLFANEATSGGMRCSLARDVRLKNGTLVERDRTSLLATVLASTHAPSKLKLEVPSDSWERMEYPSAGEARMYHGPSLRCLRKVRHGNRVAWGRIVAPALVELAGSQRDVTNWTIPSAVLDACLYAAAVLIWRQIEQAASLPYSLEMLELGRRPHPGEPCIVEVRFRRQEERYAWCDFILVGLNDDLIVRATNYCVIFHE
ncbi:MAG: beta keto-acyl synthase [Schlesneria sp.]|nr:beta keto-acyl synthase [Schlesneria sp.]